VADITKIGDFFESSPHPAWLATRRGECLYVNPALVCLTGLKSDQINQGDWRSFVLEEDRAAASTSWQRALASDTPYRTRVRLRGFDGVSATVDLTAFGHTHNDGTELWLFTGSQVHGNTQQYPRLEAQLQSTLNVIPRKRVEEQLVKSTQELKRSEAYLAEAQRLSHTGSFGWNPDTGEIVWSDETYRIFEYDCGTKPTLDMLVQRLHPQDRAFFQQVIDRASQTATDFEHEYRLLLADGRVKHVHAIAHVLEDGSGNREFIGAVTDITERKRAEEKILCNERELRTLIDVMPAYVGTCLPDGTADFLSQSWLEYSGQTREEAMGWAWAGALHPDDADRVLANWRAGLDSGEPVEMEFRCRRADGTYRWFLDRNLPLRNDEGQIIKWYGILFDIDVLKKTEAALQMREQELLGIIETIPSMLWSVSPTGQTTHLSQRCLEYCGVPLEELLNRGWESFIHPDDAEETVKAFGRAIGSGESFRAIHRLRRADGVYRWQHAMGEPLRDLRGTIIQWYGLTIDIDERKRAEDRLRDTRIKLAKASRLATVAELAGSIAHELNQPLMSILANAQAAKRWLNAASPNVMEVNSSIERTIRDARAADETMQHIRALFKQESFVKKDVKVPDILHEVVRIVQEDPRKRAVPVECYFDECLPAVPVDQIQVQQVFINLIVNAIEALEGQQAPPW
jgi:PAS domain S-box-containing protein